MTWSTVASGLVCCIVLAQNTGQAPLSNPSFVRAPGRTYYLDLDTAEGACSTWRHDDLGGLCALQASVRIPRLRKHIKWHPVFTIRLEDSVPAGKTKRVGLQIYTSVSKPPLDMRLIQFDGPDMVTSENTNTRLGLDAAIPVEIVWLPDHSVVFSIGENEIHRLKITWQIERISIAASTGQMKIDPLVLGCFDKVPHS